MNFEHFENYNCLCFVREDTVSSVSRSSYGLVRIIDIILVTLHCIFSGGGGGGGNTETLMKKKTVSINQEEAPLSNPSFLPLEESCSRTRINSPLPPKKA